MTRLNSAITEVKCDYCEKVYRLALSEDQERRWKRGQLIEHVAPHLTPAERELLMSGLCGACFEKLTARDAAV